MEICSCKNSSYKYIKSLLLKKNRDEEGVYTVEGVKSVSDAIKARAPIKMIAVSSDIDFETSHEKLIFKNDIFKGLCDTKTPQGVLAVINKHSMDKEIPRGRYIYCDKIRDPGNLGTIIRTADACSFSVLLSPECCDLYSPKTVRSSMGSFFHVKVWENVTYDDLKKTGLHLIAGALEEDSKDYRKANYKENIALVIGNEANGVTKELIALCDEKVIIPIKGEAESLNAAVAGAILMYEAVREELE